MDTNQIILPDITSIEIQLADIFNMEDMQRMQDLFSDATGVASLITLPDGTPLTTPSNFTRLCKDIIRKSEKGCANCYKSDAIIGRLNFIEPVVQRCLSGGLWDAGASIRVGGKHIANWLIGQVRNEEINSELILQYAEDINVDKAEFLEALNEVPVMSIQQFEKVAKMLFAFAGELSEKAFSNWQLKISIAEKEKTNMLLRENERALIESEEKYRTIFNNVQDVFYQIDLSGKILEVSPSIKYFSEFSREEMLGSYVYEIYANSEDRAVFLDAIKKNGEVHDYELRIRTKTGKIIYSSINARLIYDEYGVPQYIDGAIRNITIRKMAEIHRDQQLLFIKALNEIAEVIISKDTAEEILENTNRIIGETLQLDRTLIYDVSFEKKCIIGLCEWLKQDHPDIEVTKGEYPLELFLSPFTEMLRNMKYLESHEQAVGKPFTKDNSGHILHTGFKIKSLIWYPFGFYDGGYYLFTLNQILESRQWTQEEIGFLDSVVNQVNLALIKIRFLEEKKIAEKAIQESEDKYRTMIEFSNDLIWTLDNNGYFTFFNEMVTKTTDLVLEEWKGKSFLPLIMEEDVPMIADIFQRNMNGQPCSYELRFKKKDDSLLTIAVNTSPIYISGKIEGIVSFGRDITERKQSEKQLQLLNKAIEQSPVCVVITDSEGTIEYANPKFTEVSGYTLEELKGKNPRILQSGLQTKAFYEQLWDTIKSGNYWSGEFHNKKKSGESYWESAVISPIMNRQGEITSFVAVKEDITERKKLFEDLIKAKEKAEESDRLKSSFLANMSHEIRTPMNGIMGFAEILKEPDITADKQQEYLSIIERSGARMLSTINDIIDISKIESGEMNVYISETNVNTQMDFIYNFFKPEVDKKGLNILINNDLSSVNSVIFTDREKLYAILTNLVKNAIKFTKEGVIDVGYIKNEKYLQFYVKDTGVGINTDQQKNIFERFRQGSDFLTRNYEGSGLGLSISKAYVEMLGGNIWVESEENKGSTFYFTLPYPSK